MVYVVDLDDTLVLTKNLNNDAYNFALEQNGQKRIRTNNRLTRENFDGTASKKLITKSNVFLIFEDNDSLSRCKEVVSIKGFTTKKDSN